MDSVGIANGEVSMKAVIKSAGSPKPAICSLLLLPENERTNSKPVMGLSDNALISGFGLRAMKFRRKPSATAIARESRAPGREIAWRMSCS